MYVKQEHNEKKLEKIFPNKGQSGGIRLNDVHLEKMAVKTVCVCACVCFLIKDKVLRGQNKLIHKIDATGSLLALCWSGITFTSV